MTYTSETLPRLAGWVLGSVGAGNVGFDETNALNGTNIPKSYDRIICYAPMLKVLFLVLVFCFLLFILYIQ